MQLEQRSWQERHSQAAMAATLKALGIEPGAQHTSQALANTQAQRWQRDTSLAQRRSWLALRRWAPQLGTTLVLGPARRRSALAPRLSLLALQSVGGQQCRHYSECL